MDESSLSSRTSLKDCPFIKGLECVSLEAINILSIEDLLSKAPKRYEDRRSFDAIPVQNNPEPYCFRVHVVDTRWKFIPGRRYFEVVVEESSAKQSLGGHLMCRWFNFPAISHMLASGMELVLYGRVKRMGKSLVMIHPEFEVVDENAGNFIHLERIVPIYAKTGGLAQRRYREIVWHSLDLMKESGNNTQQYNHWKSLHFPISATDYKRARRLFALEECFKLQLSVVYRRRQLLTKVGLVTAEKTSYVKDLVTRLPFELTESQKQCVRDIYRDMKSTSPMNRLLQGDVGSGKTLVSLCAMLMAVEAGFQTALMAPTQILAEQHYKTCCQWLAPLGIHIVLCTGTRREETKGWGNELKDMPQIVVGTHALLYKKDFFEKLGLVVIDEQHKFGVQQREKLISLGSTPDVLVMTATPIPRTLTLTLYGDLEVSLLKEKPRGRGKVLTVVRQEKDLPKILNFVQQQVDEGRQVYVVSPLVAEGAFVNDQDEAGQNSVKRGRKGKSALREFERWQQFLPHVDIALLHGKMTSEEKERVMRDFHDNKYAVLVATTVIEVGVDVPNATMMVINDADQFGLSQLHQLRGRVGRGEATSYCILLESLKPTQEGIDKLKIFSKITDGFELAEADFKLRGPGEMFGTAQSGLGEVDFPEWLYDTSLITEARERAEAVLNHDPQLSLPLYKNYRPLLFPSESDSSVRN